MSYTWLAVVYTIGAALFDLTLRYVQRARDRSWAVAFLSSWVGAIGLVFFLNAELLRIDLYSGFFLLLSGILWSLMVFWDFKALAHTDVSVGVMISALRTIFLVFIGWCLFSENITVIDILGGLAILLGVGINIRPAGLNDSLGVRLRIYSVAAGSAAIIVDKYLVSLVDVRLVVFCGYLLPGILYIYFRPSDWREQFVIREMRYRIAVAVAVVLFATLGSVFVVSFGLGELGATMTIAQCRAMLVILLAHFVLGERSDPVRRFVGAALCSGGAAAVLTW